jgi:nucleotide-binding universal stress UspA family protein
MGLDSGPTVSARSGAVAPGRSAGAPIHLVMLATDLSPVSDHAADAAIQLAHDNDATLIVMSVVDTERLRLPGGRFLRRVDQERARVEAAAQALVLRARSAGARATFLVWEGDPAETILLASESEHADVLVVGTHGRGRFGRFIRGSISSRVSEQAACEVLIVPPETGRPA